MYETYVMHYSKLNYRKIHIENELKRLNIDNYKIITEFDKDDIDDNILNKYYNPDYETAKIHAKVSNDYIKSEYTHSIMKMASISLCIKWIKAIEYFIKSGSEFGLFIEDDCSFINKDIDIDVIIKECPLDWDVIFIGGSFSNIAPVKRDMEKYFLANDPSTNTTSSLIIKKRTAEIILNDMIPFYLPIDWEFNHIFHKNNFNVYHTKPYIATQISSTIFRSTVQ